MIRRLRSGGYLNEVAQLATGTTLAHIVTVLSYLVITKLYTPDEFGLFSFFFSSVVILSVVSTAAYEHAIVLPADSADGLNLFRLSSWLSFLFAVLLTISALLFTQPLSGLTGLPVEILLLIPLGLLLVAQFNTLTFLFVRNESYKALSTAKLYQSSLTALFQIGFGLFKISVAGLVYGFISGRLLSNIYLYTKTETPFKRLFLAQKEKVRAVAKTYKEQPCFFLPSRLLTQGAVEVPVLLIGSLFGNSLLGYYALAFRVLSVPSAFVGTSVGHVFYKRCNDLRIQKKALRPLLLKTWAGLFGTGLLPLLGVYLYGETIFSFVFGAEWIQAGTVAVILAPVLLFQFVTAPTEKALLVLNKQKAIPLFSGLDFTGRNLGIILGFLASDFVTGVLFMAAFQGLAILILNTYLFIMVTRHDREVAQ